MNNDLISRSELKNIIHNSNLSGNREWLLMQLDNLIDNAPTVEPEKVLVANVTFDKDQLEQIIRDRVIEPIKNGELVLQTDQRPQGKWIDEGQYAEGHDEHAYVCKKCGYQIIENPDMIYENRFCKYCGADMRTKENNNV